MLKFAEFRSGVACALEFASRDAVRLTAVPALIGTIGMRTPRALSTALYSRAAASHRALTHFGGSRGVEGRPPPRTMIASGRDASAACVGARAAH